MGVEGGEGSEEGGGGGSRGFVCVLVGRRGWVD